MTDTYRTPGVYVEEIARLPPAVAPVETAIPAFIGYTETAQSAVADDLLLKPLRIASMADYEAHFGGPQKEERIAVTVTGTAATAMLREEDRSRHILHYAMQLFFANGGGACIIVSVGPYKALGTVLVGSELDAGLSAVAAEDEPTLIVIPEAQSLPMADYRALMDRALEQCARLEDRFLILDAHGGDISMAKPTADLLTGIDHFRDNGIGAANLKYGAAYAPHVATTIVFAYDETRTAVNGLAAGPQTLDQLAATQSDLHAAARTAIGGMRCILPPSAAIAGVYAAVDAGRGVWKAPANIALSAVTGPMIPLTNTQQDTMTVDPAGGKSVNAIRLFPGKGTLVWGARTLAGNHNEWRYVSVRRLFLFVEESVKKATTPFAFEPNDVNSWAKVQGMIGNFLTGLWRQGALQGAKPEHAFSVAVGLGKTMTTLDILEGRMIVEIGMAPVRPAEFIILRFTQKMAEA